MAAKSFYNGLIRFAFDRARRTVPFIVTSDAFIIVACAVAGAATGLVRCIQTAGGGVYGGGGPLRHIVRGLVVGLVLGMILTELVGLL